MSYTLSGLSDDVRTLLRDRNAADCSAELCQLVSKALLDNEFVTRHLPDRAEGESPRKVLFEDPELGFCICGHVHSGEAIGEPHDHGHGWALYGQAAGVTEMIDWEVVDAGSADNPKLVRPVKTYEMNPGDAHFYDVGAVHSPKRTKPTRLIRIESENLDNVTRSSIQAAPE